MAFVGMIVAAVQREKFVCTVFSSTGVARNLLTSRASLDRG